MFGIKFFRKESAFERDMDTVVGMYREALCREYDRGYADQGAGAAPEPLGSSSSDLDSSEGLSMRGLRHAYMVGFEDSKKGSPNCVAESVRAWRDVK